MEKNQIVKYKTTLVNFLGTNESDIKDNLKGDRWDRQETWENIVRQGKDLLSNFAGKSTPDGDVGTNEIRVFWSPEKIANTFYGTGKTIEELISTTVPFVNHIQRGDAKESDLVFYYFYLWQAIDSTSKINEDLIYLSNGGYEYAQPNITLGRKYSMSVAGIPTTLNLDEVASWSPSVWPFFLDAQNGKGYEFTYLGQSEIGLESSNQGSLAVASAESNDLVKSQFQNSILSIAKVPPYPEDGDNLPPETGGGVNPGGGGGGGLPRETYFDDYYAKYRVDVEPNEKPNEKTAKPGTGKLININDNATSYGIRIYSINGSLIAMRDETNRVGGERMWKLDKNLTVTIDSDGRITFNSNDLRLARGEGRAVIQYTDQNGQVRVYSAYELEKQKPCAQQPFGPPLDIENISAKVYYSKNISSTLWNWIQQVAFSKNGNQ